MALRIRLARAGDQAALNDFLCAIDRALASASDQDSSSTVTASPDHLIAEDGDAIVGALALPGTANEGVPITGDDRTASLLRAAATMLTFIRGESPTTTTATCRRLIRLDLPPRLAPWELPVLLVAAGDDPIFMAMPGQIAGGGLRLYHEAARSLGLAPGEACWAQAT